jgi:cytochrome c oxidase subunit 2
MSAALRIALVAITLGCLYLFVVHPLWFPAAASAEAGLIDHDFSVAFWILGALFVAGQAVLVFVLIRRPAVNGQSRSWRGNFRFEIGWTLAIAVIFFGFHISGGHLWSKLHQPEQHANHVTVEVTGAQFQWYFRYPGPDGVFGRTNATRFAKPDEGNPLGIDPADPAGRDDIVATSLVVPVGRPVQLELRAQDVIHSLFIPAMRFKQDAVPGMAIETHFTPTRLGSYEISCAELCGIGHYRMRAVVRVVSEEEFQKWLQSQTQTASSR